MIASHDRTRWSKILQRGNVPRPILTRANLKDSKAETYADAVRKYIHQIPTEQGAFLYGGPKTGKQHAAAILLRNWVKRDRMVLWIESEDLRRAAFPFSKYMFDDSSTMWERAEQVDVLLIAHLGVEKRTDDFKASLSMLLRKRSGANKVTLFTSYLAPVEVKEEYGEDVASAIQSTCIPMNCDPE